MVKVLPVEIIDRILPVANRDKIKGLTDAEKLEWSLLDTYDWFNPTYDKPQTWNNVESTLSQIGYRYQKAPLVRRGLHCIRISSNEVDLANLK